MEKSKILGLLFSEPFERNTKILEDHFNGNVDELSALLKCHLSVERNLRDFCDASVPNPSHLKRFQFAQVLNLTKALLVEPKGQDMGWIWGAVTLLNELRNSYAHEFDPDPSKIQEKKENLMKLVKPQLEGEPAYRDAEIPFHVYLGVLIGALSAYLYYVVETRAGIKE
ncbi:hypothetical protein [Pseudomonas sp. Irchel 3E20]|uniref:hypothetical protein n=1 Tax=Pseudomonas sp. Irchel 3E20 TaxID=2008983 RepID=UPI000BA3D086|nr:hypothetical protein [Pseudomonas sp. Irchel 3E20]